PRRAIAVPARIKPFRVYQFSSHDLNVTLVVPGFQPLLDDWVFHWFADDPIIFLVDHFPIQKRAFAILKSDFAFQDTGANIRVVHHLSDYGRQVVVVAVWNY